MNSLTFSKVEHKVLGEPLSYNELKDVDFAPQLKRLACFSHPTGLLCS